ADPGERGDRVGPPRLGRPDRGEAEPLGLLDELEVEGDLGAGVPDHQTETHASLLARDPTGTNRWGPPIGPHCRRGGEFTRRVKHVLLPSMLERADASQGRSPEPVGLRGDLEHGTLPRLVQSAAERFAGLPAVVDEGTSLTYAELAAAAGRA